MQPEKSTTHVIVIKVIERNAHAHLGFFIFDHWMHYKKEVDAAACYMQTACSVRVGANTSVRVVR